MSCPFEPEGEEEGHGVDGLFVESEKGSCPRCPRANLSEALMQNVSQGACESYLGGDQGQGQPPEVQDASQGV